MARRTQKVIRRDILKNLTSNPKSIREIAVSSKIDWYTCERQLNYLKGREVAEEVLRHRQLRLFRITGLGRGVKLALRKGSKDHIINMTSKVFK